MITLISRSNLLDAVPPEESLRRRVVDISQITERADAEQGDRQCHGGLGRPLVAVFPRQHQGRDAITAQLIEQPHRDEPGLCQLQMDGTGVKIGRSQLGQLLTDPAQRPFRILGGLLIQLGHHARGHARLIAQLQAQPPLTLLQGQGHGDASLGRGLGQQGGKRLVMVTIERHPQHQTRNRLS